MAGPVALAAAPTGRAGTGCGAEVLQIQLSQALPAGHSKVNNISTVVIVLVITLMTIIEEIIIMTIEQ